MLNIFQTILGGLTGVSLVYLLLATLFVRRRGRARKREGSSFSPPVTVLKPLKGLEWELFENLSSFCEQDYPCVQVLFGVTDPEDPAIPVVQELIAQHPERDLALVVGEKKGGANDKCVSLHQMMEQAKHPFIVIADSDMRVEKNYLRQVLAEFQEEKVGAVTCLYTGTPAPTLPSRLLALFIREWFLPSVLVACALQKLRYCFGATMAVRRELLEKIGGFERLSHYLADDYMLGKLVFQAGFEVRLSTYIVENRVFEPSLPSLFSHELRWARTVRSCEPLGYAFNFLSQGTLTLAFLFALSTGWEGIGLAFFVLGYLLRILCHLEVMALTGKKFPRALWLFSLRDALSVAVWAIGLFGKRVEWRNRKLSLDVGNKLIEEGGLYDADIISQPPLI